MALMHSQRGAFETVVLADGADDSLLEIAPARGGLATRLRLRGREMLYLDEDTFRDPAKNVRGGIPILFPIAGKLPGDAATVAGKRVAMTQHGFARRMPFRVVADAEPAVAGAPAPPESVTLLLASDDATRAQFPFEFELRVRYALAGGALRCETSVRNTGAEPLPAHLGFHPYFSVRDVDKASSSVDVRATRALDLLTGRTGDYRAPDLAAAEVDLHILDPNGGAARIRVPGGAVHLDYGAFPCVVVWTQRGKDFICLEPWSAPAGALASGDGLEWIAPGAECHRMFFIRMDGPAPEPPPEPA